MAYRYRRDVLDELWRHGVHPNERTPPDTVHEFVNDLYRYELRCLRDRLLRKEIPKRGYADRVIELRRRYPLLALKWSRWIE
jgi:hypothetical protein